MYHEHPLRILKYSAKNIWLLIFPLLRGVHAITLDVNKLYSWLKGAWFDIAVIGAIIIFGLIRWYFSMIIITDDGITHRDGVFIKITTMIPFSKLSSVTAEHSFYLRPFRGMRIYCDTSAGFFKTSDMKLMVGKRVYSEIVKRLPESYVKESTEYRKKSAVLSVLMFSVFFSSSFSGAVYVAAFFFKGGDIAKDFISVSLERITEETSKLQKLLIVNIPAAAIGIGSFFLATWFLSFILNMLRYSGFRIKDGSNMIEISCGTFTRYKYRIFLRQINYTDLRQNLIMKLCKAVTVYISCAGYGSVNKRLPILFPLKKEKGLNSGIEKLGACSGNKNEFRPKLTSLWQYVWLPVITALLIYPVSEFAEVLFPGFSEFSVFFVIMAEIPAIWLIIVKISSLLTNGVYVYEEKIMVKYSKWFDFHTVIAERERLVKMNITQTPFQKLARKCTVGFYFNGEQSQRHSVKAIKISDAEKIAVLLGYYNLCSGSLVSK